MLPFGSLAYAGNEYCNAEDATTPPAFPGEGHAAHVTGGRGGEIYHATNLEDSGNGSLYAVGGSHRIVVFDVGGYIVLKSALSVASDITIAGQLRRGRHWHAKL